MTIEDKPGEVSAEALEAASKFIEEEEGATNAIAGWFATLTATLAILSTLFHLYAAAAGSFPFESFPVIATYMLRPAHVGIVLLLIFLLFPAAPSLRNRTTLLDWIGAGLSVAVIGYLLWQGEDIGDRAVAPEPSDMIAGVLLIVLLLEATRRATGLIMPVVSLFFLAYAYFGPYLPQPWTHKGYAIDRLVGQLTMTLEGVFGTAVDVSSSLIILFTIFGAVLQYSGAGKFFIDFSFAALGGKRNAAGRAVVLSSFLMGGPSGSGVATTVTIGAVAYPLLARSGYEKNAAGGLLAAGGLGAIISPPVLGAAAFLIAEFLKISYFDVILMATIPTVLYYFGILVMVEIDARRFGGNSKSLIENPSSLWELTKNYWFHFGSLISIIIFMLIGFSPVLAVFWATITAVLVSYLRRDTALTLPKLKRAAVEGTTGVLNAAITCASAGIIVGVVTLTGLGLKFSAIAIAYAGGSLLLTAIYTALIVWVIGLAVPVTASYIICAVIAAPALTKLGVPDFAAHMFIFYYAVLSEVSPPTALSPFAAAAITGGNAYKTTMQSWKYTMPAFLVPFVFVLDPMGIGLLLKTGPEVGWFGVAWVTAKTALGIVALAIASQGWLVRKCSLAQIGVFTLSGLLFIFPELFEPLARGLGLGGFIRAETMLAFAALALGLAMHWRTRGVSGAASPV